ncbi:DNRLRE domain-containing protein [Pontiella sulfatireligans]|uniref:Carbohydrate-binding module family 96 domain-containing protein n=1 Tax=Pontiella sulfatireligans TaxID=2750658 RepID=A0A6C2URR9_9BACT|nr:DNRLRE domain-containing protein [Pontiella sulfatireligans]VGO21941.1 hypothetical protein SCARR_04021 [Pontiella sulfatireligans]
MKQKVILSVFGLMAGVAATSASVIGVDADTYVKGGTATDSVSGIQNNNTNYGTRNTMEVKATDGKAKYINKGYLRFDLATMTAPAEVNASINLTLLNSGVYINPLTVTVYGLLESVEGQDWGETSITFNNAPGNDTAGSGVVAADTVLLGTFEVSDVASDYSFNSAALVNFLNADTDDLATFILIGDTAGDSYGYGAMSFSTKENSTYGGAVLDTIPEPGTMGLISAVGASLLFIRRVFMIS